MSTSERPLVLTSSPQRQQLPSVTELPLTANSTSDSGPLSSSAHTTAAQKPFSNFIDVIVAAFTQNPTCAFGITEGVRQGGQRWHFFLDRKTKKDEEI
ncbi:unnamed protein product [Litomosoides sigmodontis]|uniref:Uncharacterized protein n=1 Tax=Litomosoides sigmodontis TaxID=42156 RepID=A0A3P6T4C8_LITSI|nr:unnamed protein product [Litomosoides sigmodontis]